MKSLRKSQIPLRALKNHLQSRLAREVRIMVSPENIKDDSITLIARDIVKKIENELEYPGQIKVNVIRETRAVEYAK